MLLQRLAIENFRCFESLEMDFEATPESKLTVIIAKNGQGKTAILEAISVNLGAFVGAFDLGKSKSINTNDVRYQQLLRTTENAQQYLINEQQYPVKIDTIFSFPMPDGSVFEDKSISTKATRELNSKKSRTTIKNAAPLVQYGKELMDKVRQLDEDVTLPAIAYYPASRLWSVHKNIERKAVLIESRSMGYEDCLSSSSSFKQVQQWMHKATLAVGQQKTMTQAFNTLLPIQLDGIKKAVNQVLKMEGWSDFQYNFDYDELVMFHKDHGYLPISLLSDGVRAMVSLVADLAWRCTKLNAHLGDDAASKTPGIVLIDEIDLHLHPSWQQKVIGVLQNTFKNIQFIITTHSPQVLTTVNNKSIRIITENNIKLASVQTLDEESRVALEDVMEVSSYPNTEKTHLLVDYLKRIGGGEIDSPKVKKLREELTSYYGSNFKRLRLADMEINRQRVLQAKK